MKIYIFLIIGMLSVPKAFALHIQQLTLWSLSPQTINISLNTEAVELYYFQDWQYEVSGNTITLKAFYVSGFGSTIASLNNNFEIPVNTQQANTYNLRITIYYANQFDNNQEPEQQDEMQVVFQTPLEPLVFLDTEEPTPKTTVVFYPNPTDGNLYVNGTIDSLEIFDSHNSCILKTGHLNNYIDLSILENGVYLIKIYQGQSIQVEKILKR